jgi:hypothetical protein
MVYKNKGNIRNGDKAKGNGDFSPEHQGRKKINNIANESKFKQAHKQKEKKREKLDDGSFVERKSPLRLNHQLLSLIK